MWIHWVGCDGYDMAEVQKNHPIKFEMGCRPDRPTGNGVVEIELGIKRAIQFL
jgi:hypothetical protein